MAELQRSECRLLVSAPLETVDREQVLQQLAISLQESGCVKPSYVQAVIERERDYPTGVQLEGPINVALAHAGPEHVLKNGIILGILAEAVPFYKMNEPQNLIPIQIVFMLATVSPAAIAFYMDKLINEVLMKPDVIAWLANTKNAETIKMFFESEVFAAPVE